MEKQSKILVVGHNDIIETSLYTRLKERGYTNVYSSSDLGLDASIQPSVYKFFQDNRPDYVFLGSTRSGGIEANIKFGGEFIYHNLESQNNIIYASQKFGTKKLLYFAGSCIYPKDAAQPMTEGCLLTGPLEKTSEPYSVAKIAGVLTAQAYRRQYGLNAIVAVPATVYGPGSDTDLQHAHVMGALIAKFHKAALEQQKSVTVWGSGSPKREFLYADDFADGAILLMESYDDEEIINLGVGEDVSIKELAQTIKSVSGFTGDIEFDSSKPDGTNQKLLDSSRIGKLGFSPKVGLKEGIEKTFEWFNNRN